MTCLAFSPNGRRLLSGSEDSTLLVWDVESGEIVQRLEGHRGSVGVCAFLPSERVVSGGVRGEVFVWDVAAGKLIRKLGSLSEAHDVYALGARSDGREVIVGTDNGRVVAWNVDTGDETFPANDELRGGLNASRVWTAGFMSDGRRFAGGEAQKTIVWGKATSTSLEGGVASGVALPGSRLALGRSGEVAIAAAGKVVRMLEGHEGWVYGLAASPSGDRLIAADSSGRGRVWHVATGITQCLLDAKASYSAAAWAPTGDRLAVAGDDGLVRVGEVAACSGGKALSVRALGAPRGRVRAVAVGRNVLLGDSKGRVSAWDTGTWQLTQSTAAHAGEVTSLVALADGRWVSGGDDGAVLLGVAGTLGPTHAPGTKELARLKGQVSAMTALPGGAAVLAANDSRDITEILLGGGAKPPRWTAPNAVFALAVEPGGAAALVGGMLDTVVRVPLTKDGDWIEWPAALVLPQASTTALAYLPDSRFAQASTNGDVLLRRGETVEKRFTGLSKDVSALAVVGPYLWAGGEERALLRWTIEGALQPAASDRRIDEGAGLLRLAATADHRFLIAGLDDGRASVRSLPDGELVAHLYPFRDGSAATILADGQYHASRGDAYALRLEDPATRKIVTLGDLLTTRITAPLVTPLPDGSVAVHATVFSPSGPPSVTLDGGWTIEAVAPSRTALLAYELDLQLVQPRGGSHKLTAQPPEGETVTASFDVLPDPRFFSGKGRALVIGNSEYKHRPKLPGATKDVALVRAFLESAEGWHLSPDRIESPANLEGNGRGGNGLRAAAASFFARAEADETLFFYFSGHGESDAAQGYLLPTDAPEGTRAGALSASELWKMVRASKAGRIVLLIDACRAGRFVVPTDLALQSKAVVLAATEPGGTARDFASGGAFTRAWLKSLARVEAIDEDVHAVTVSKAFYVAANEASAQSPLMYGMGDILRLPLAWPASKKLDRRAALNAGSAEGTGFRSASAELLTPTRPGDKGMGAVVLDRNGKLEIEVVFDRPTEAVKISAYQPEDGYRAKPKIPPNPWRIQPAPAGVWGEGKTANLKLWDVKADTGGLIELRACSADGTKCGLPKLLTLPAPK